MAAKLTRLAHKIAIQLHLVAESCIICSSRSRRAVLELLDTPSYVLMDNLSRTILYLSNSWMRAYLSDFCVDLEALRWADAPFKEYHPRTKTTCCSFCICSGPNYNSRRPLAVDAPLAGFVCPPRGPAASVDQGSNHGSPPWGAQWPCSSLLNSTTNVATAHLFLICLEMAILWLVTHRRISGVTHQYIRSSGRFACTWLKIRKGNALPDQSIVVLFSTSRLK
jgi:hypothetical protein